MAAAALSEVNVPRRLSQHGTWPSSLAKVADSMVLSHESLGSQLSGCQDPLLRRHILCNLNSFLLSSPTSPGKGAGAQSQLPLF